jgi:molybdenum cofactor cytidylyltransferase
MIFDHLPLAEAEGAILAHSMRLGDIAFKKGRVLSKDDLAHLHDHGHPTVLAARLEVGDVPENVAAEQVAAAAAGLGVRSAAPFTGRANMYAEIDGILVTDQTRIDRLNLLNESVTVATLAPFERVAAGQMVATVKIIPFAAPDTAVNQAEAVATDDGPLFRVAPFVPRRMGVVTTLLPGTQDKVLQKAERVISARIAGVKGTITERRRCTHTPQAVADAVRELIDAECAPVLVLGASATVDRRDVVPAGIELAGGTVDHFGMPVDPGNLLLLAHYGAVPVIGIPGCARSPKLNGFDWVLERLAAGVPVGRRDIMLMGAGGLLKEIPGRPQPRDSTNPAARTAKKIAAVILAAGQSRRMGKANKLLAPVDGAPMVTQVVDAALASGAHPIVVVTGHEAEQVAGALQNRDVTFHRNPEYAAGLSTSLRVGLGALPGDVDGALICLGDMPRVTEDHLKALMAAFDPEEGRAICVPTKDGKRGNPVLWSARFFDDMARVAGDVGARHIIGDNVELVCEVPIEDDAIFLDLDTPAALQAATQNSGGDP